MSHPKQHSWFRHLGHALLAMLVITMFVSANSVDGPAVSDADLLAKIPPVTPGKNGYTPLAYLDDDDFKLIGDDAQLATLKAHLSGEHWDQPYVDQLLSRHADLFTHVTQAVTRPYFRTKNKVWEVNQPITRYSNYVNAARMLVLRAASQMRDNQPSHASASLRDALALGRLISTDPSTGLLGYAMGTAIAYEPLAFIQRQVRQDSVTPQTLDAFRQALTTMPAYASDGFANAFIAEQILVIRDHWDGSQDSLTERLKAVVEELKPMLKSLIRDPNRLDRLNYAALSGAYALAPRFYHHPNRTEAGQVQSYALATQQHGLFCQQITFAESSISWTDLFVPNSVGQYIINPGVIDERLRRYFEGRCMFHTYANALKQAIEIKDAQLLQAPIPTTTFIDYFTGEPIAHNTAEQRLSWSGGNYRTDGGDKQHAINGRCRRRDACFSDPTILLREPPVHPELAPPVLALPVFEGPISATGAMIAPYAK